MRKILFVILIGMLLGFNSCKEDEDLFKYSGENYVSFIEASSAVTAIGGDANAFEIELGVTTSSDVARTYTVEVVAAESTAVEGTDFNLDSKSIIIEAGKFKGAVTLTPVFDNVPLDGISITLKLVAQDTAAYSIMKHTIDIGKYCTLDLDAFVGEYTVTDGADYGVATISRDPEDALFGLIITDPLSYWGFAAGAGGVLKIKLNACDGSVSCSKQATGAIHPTNGELSLEKDGIGTFDATAHTISFEVKHTVAAGSFGTWLTVFTKK